MQSYMPGSAGQIRTVTKLQDGSIQVVTEERGIRHCKTGVLNTDGSVRIYGDENGHKTRRLCTIMPSGAVRIVEE